MNLRSYPEYKDSGVEFLGPIPSHWSVPPAVELARVLTSSVDKKSSEDEIPVQLCNYTDVYYSDLIDSGADYMRATASQDQIDAYSVRRGDVPFTKDSETSDDIGISAYVERDLPGVVYGYHLSIYRPRDIKFGKYLKWLLDSKYVKATFETRTPGVTRVGLSQNTMRYLRVPTPPAAEAALIAEYLDHETGEIDAFIADQEELITLLSERRAATISHAITKGLDASVPMRDSGVEWVGLVPAGWDVAKAARIGDTFGSEPVDESQIVVDGTITFLKVSSLSASGFQIQKREWFLNQARSAERNEFIVFPKRGAAIFGNKVNIVHEAAVLDPNLMGWKLRRGYHTRYYAYLLRAVRLEEIADVSTVPQINSKHIDSLRVPCPPFEEQVRIAAFLDRETAELDATVTDAREAIALSKERRAAIISAAVTGKIDVRGEVGNGHP